MKQKKEITGFTKGELEKLRRTDFSKLKGFVEAGEILGKEAGESGSFEREVFDAKARAWYYGEILRQRRKDLGLTQKELAEKVGRERTYINRIEKGETDLQLSSFIRIAAALGIVLRLEFL
ncbi:MAG: helix-turn-helix transcriptional regulator [Bacteroidales bacterium]|nr:helix-turn-helix transcriptional regulator [Bacteroidales bacterium]